MLSTHTVQTPEATITITWNLWPVTETHVENEGRATVLRIGRMEIVVDPDAAPRRDHEVVEEVEVRPTAVVEG
jgi:hypothetical protein